MLASWLCDSHNYIPSYLAIILRNTIQVVARPIHVIFSLRKRRQDLLSAYLHSYVLILALLYFYRGIIQRPRTTGAASRKHTFSIIMTVIRASPSCYYSVLIGILKIVLIVFPAGASSW